MPSLESEEKESSSYSRRDSDEEESSKAEDKYAEETSAVDKVLVSTYIYPPSLPCFNYCCIAAQGGLHRGFAQRMLVPTDYHVMFMCCNVSWATSFPFYPSQYY